MSNPFDAVDALSLTDEPYDMWLLHEYGMIDALRELVQDVFTDGRDTFIPARRLMRGDVIIEGDKRYKVTDHPVRAPRLGIGHVFVTVGNLMWRYEPEALVQIR